MGLLGSCHSHGHIVSYLSEEGRPLFEVVESESVNSRVGGRLPDALFRVYCVLVVLCTSQVVLGDRNWGMKTVMN